MPASNEAADGCSLAKHPVALSDGLPVMSPGKALTLRTAWWELAKLRGVADKSVFFTSA